MGNIKKSVWGEMTKKIAGIAGQFKSSKTESGTITLFVGPSGSGKSTAVKALAAETGLDIYRIDLAAMVSKYIGETEKNLTRVLEKTEARNVILFFDEADAFFGQRTEIRDAHDRYANIDTNDLLQRIEQYPGPVIIATNNKKNLDQALLQRVQSVIEFPIKS